MKRSDRDFPRTPGRRIEEITEEEEELSQPIQETHSYNDSALDDSISFFRVRNWLEFDSDSDDNMSFTQQQIDRELGIPVGWEVNDPAIFVYIDDANGVEKVRIPGSVVNISQM